MVTADQRDGSPPVSAATGWAIRRALPADAETIAPVHADSWRRTYRGMMSDAYLDGDVVSERLSAWRQRMTAPRGDQRVWIASTAAGLLGFICVFADEDPRRGVYVENLHVRHDAQGSGLGTTLLQTAAAWTNAEQPRQGLWLWVMEANHSARRFYQRLGGVETDRTMLRDPAGGSAPNLRCCWSDVRPILDKVHPREPRPGHCPQPSEGVEGHVRGN